MLHPQHVVLIKNYFNQKVHIYAALHGAMIIEHMASIVRLNELENYC